jgi:toxin-antitoxin system PIN domain toxin
MACLLDVNVLVALSWPNHVHHERAREWFTDHHSAGWATCSATQTGFVRVSSNAKVVPEARSPREAMLLLRQYVALPGHEYWNDDVQFVDSEFVAEGRIVGHRQVTDAHLVALTMRHAGRLVTFDRRLADVLPARAAASDTLWML